MVKFPSGIGCFAYFLDVERHQAAPVRQPEKLLDANAIFVRSAERRLGKNVVV
jgi:hypothetical protein